jgi:hypothetical protein
MLVFRSVTKHYGQQALLGAFITVTPGGIAEACGPLKAATAVDPRPSMRLAGSKNMNFRIQLGKTVPLSEGQPAMPGMRGIA